MRKRYEKGLVMRAEWLDKLTFPEMERLREKERKNSTDMHLMIEFPRVIVDGQDCTVVYFEKEAEHPCHLLFDSDMLVVPDPEILLENLAESKHHKLSRSLRSGVCDRDLKPNPQTRDLLNQIANYPSTKSLTSEEQDLVWKFRFYLINQKKALAKFLKCPHWNVASEAAQAIELLPKWSPMDIEDALELLSPQFQHPAVRKYAVSRLRQAPDEDLLLYLLQLVQALRYENYDRKEIILSDGTSAQFDECQDNDSDLAAFLIERATGDERLANFFYWYLAVEIEEHKPADASQATNQLPSENRIYYMYLDVMSKFSRKLDTGSPEQKQIREFLRRQQDFVEDLVKLMKEVAREKGDRIKKIERLRHLISSNERFTSFEPLPLPLDPDVRINAIQPEKASLFKSALMPSRLSFTTVQNQEYVTILKYGDDLRQDQLILQTITLIDKLLRRENLDLKLTPYRVLATSSKHGFVQYIESMSVAEVLKNYGDSIQRFFRSHAAQENAPYGISPEVMDTYVKSCAGYCIITYLLGVGDRHLDNLLLTKSGNLFHIDFGYILGRDPKPFPPPMKLSREMVEGMGGVNSEHYQQFKKLCYTAFLHLRRHANLILNLFTLMVDATIPDIALEPDKTVKKVQDKFRLELSDEEAVHHIQTLIEVSATAVMASLVEQVHKFAQVSIMPFSLILPLISL
jgi:phosphatidylinositol 3-kinase